MAPSGRCARLGASDREAERLGHRADRVGDRHGAHHEQQRRGQQGLEEDLERPAGQARVHHDARTRRRRECRVALGQHAQQRALAVAQCGQCGDPDGAFGALATDESLDRTVGQDDRVVARARGRGELRAHDRGVHERHPAAHQLGNPSRHAMNHVLPNQIGGVAFPRIASHTRDGVSGMSAWRTPNGLSASITAFTIAGGDPTVADSPIPFAPIG